MDCSFETPAVWWRCQVWIWQEWPFCTLDRHTPPHLSALKTTEGWAAKRWNRSRKGESSALSTSSIFTPVLGDTIYNLTGTTNRNLACFSITKTRKRGLDQQKETEKRRESTLFLSTSLKKHWRSACYCWLDQLYFSVSSFVTQRYFCHANTAFNLMGECWVSSNCNDLQAIDHNALKAEPHNTCVSTHTKAHTQAHFHTQSGVH